MCVSEISLRCIALFEGISRLGDGAPAKTCGRLHLDEPVPYGLTLPQHQPSTFGKAEAAASEGLLGLRNSWTAHSWAARRCLLGICYINRAGNCLRQDSDDGRR